MRKILLILLLISATAQAQWFPTINSQVPLLNNNNTFTGTNYFNKIVADTITINNITKANSTYWINGTDTLGWVDAARNDIVFFPQMTVGTLTTNTTVANNFVRTNQVQTDTLMPHSPLVLAGDSTIANKVFAKYINTRDSIRTKNVLLDTLDFKDFKIYSRNTWIHFTNEMETPNIYCNNYGFYQGSFQFWSDSAIALLKWGAGEPAKASNLYIDGKLGYEIDHNNYRFLRLGWSRDSVGYIGVMNKGYCTARPFRMYQAAFDTAPSSASDTGTAGEIRFCSDAIYICTATNTWRKATVSTW